MRRCMIVEKSSVVRKVAKRILGTPDTLVVVAESGRQALSMCEAEMPDVIVVDIDLPDVDIVDWLDALGAVESPVRPYVVVSMTEMDLSRFMRAKRAGANDYLLKPFDRNQLLGRFRSFPRAA